MEIAQSIERYLQRKDVTFAVHAHELETSLSKLCEEMGILARWNANLGGRQIGMSKLPFPSCCAQSDRLF